MARFSFRFRRGIKLLPGVRLNMATRTPFSSITFGTGHVHVNVPVQRKGPASVSIGRFGGFLKGLSAKLIDNTPPPPPRYVRDFEAAAEQARADLKADQARRMEELLKKQAKRKTA